MTTARRIVAAVGKDGKSHVALDEAVPPADAGTSVTLTNLWTASVTPIDNATPFNGGFVPFTMDQMNAAAYAMTVVEYAPGVGQYNPGMHATETVDHFYVVEGEIVMVLDMEEAVFRAGDTGIIRGAAHGWRNDGPKIARLVFFVLPANPMGRQTQISPSVATTSIVSEKAEAGRSCWSSHKFAEEAALYFKEYRINGGDGPHSRSRERGRAYQNRKPSLTPYVRGSE